MSRYICIEGNIGAGKTTLAKALAHHMNGRLVLEEFEENTFLKKFYENPSRYAFPVEMSFLSERYRQLQEVLFSSEDLFQKDIIADYSLYKSMLFAKNNLEAHEYSLYMDFYKIVQSKIKAPDLIVYLERPLSSIEKNIKKRGRSYEMNIKTAYLQSIKEKYSMLFKQHPQAKLLMINADEYDFIDNEEHIKMVIQEVNRNCNK